MFQHHLLITFYLGIILGSATACNFDDKDPNTLRAPRDLSVASGGGSKVELSWHPPPDISVQDIIRYEYELNATGRWHRMGPHPPFVLDLHHIHELHMVKIRAVDEHGAGESTPGVFAAATLEDTTIRQRSCTAGGSGASAANPVIICSYKDLIDLHEYYDDEVANKYFALGTHIDATPSFTDGDEECDPFQPKFTPAFDTCTGWKPLPPFRNSHFDGRNHLIVGLYGQFGQRKYGGFISRMNRASTLANIQLRSVYFFTDRTSDTYLGGLVGSLESGQITFSSVAGGRLASGGVVGGLAGYLGKDNQTSELTNSYARPIILGSARRDPLRITAPRAGGLVGIARHAHLHSVAAITTLKPWDDEKPADVVRGGLVGRLEANSTLAYAMAEAQLPTTGTAGYLAGIVAGGSRLSDVAGASATTTEACGQAAPVSACTTTTPGPDGFIAPADAAASDAAPAPPPTVTTAELDEPKICIRNCPCLMKPCADAVFKDASIFSLPGYIQ